MTTELTPDLIALKNELMPAIRRDHQRRQRRRKLVRTSTVSFAAFAALSGSALAAGDALNIINLGGGASAAAVSTIPVWDSSTGTFVSGTVNGQYIYELTGVPGASFACGPATPIEADYITSTRPLSQRDLEGLLDPNNPIGLNPNANDTALGITSTGGGCFPAAVVGGSGSNSAAPTTSSGATSQTGASSALAAKLRALEKTNVQQGAPTSPSPTALAKALGNSHQTTESVAHQGGRLVLLKRSILRKNGKSVTVYALQDKSRH